MAVANQVTTGTVTVLLGNGSGGFTAAKKSPFLAGDHPWSVGIGDCNGDGKTDLAVANYYNNKVTVLLGDASGGFMQAASGLPTGI